jgi:hypothetical protein
MNLIKTANGGTLKLTKADWEGIGKQAGWLTKKAGPERFQPAPEPCPKCGGKLFYINKGDPAKMYGCFNCLESGLYFSQAAVENKASGQAPA